MLSVNNVITFEITVITKIYMDAAVLKFKSLANLEFVDNEL